MNVYRITLVLICFATAKGSFPAVIFNWSLSLTTPEMLPISDTEVEVGFEYLYDYLYAACPLPGHKQGEENEIPGVLVAHKIANAEHRFFLDAQPQPLCELEPQVTTELKIEAGEFMEYEIGYRMFRGKLDDKGSIPSSTQNENSFAFGSIFTLRFNRDTKNPISVEYKLSSRLRFISTASNKKHTFVYQKNENEEFLNIDLDSLYHIFNDQILPRMLEEKSANQLAHALGIQKVQLAMSDDFPIDTWKMATYWNINTVPIWRVLLPRWNAIEIYLRDVCKRGGIKIEIDTGIMGTFDLAERYYENDTAHKLHIPKYVWKLLTFSDHPYWGAMFIVMHNDPFTEHQQPLCEDICAINGWLVSNNDHRTGLVYCCQMTKNITEILNYRDFAIHSFTKNRDGTENLEEISRILSDPQEKLYDW